LMALMKAAGAFNGHVADMAATAAQRKTLIPSRGGLPAQFRPVD